MVIGSLYPIATIMLAAKFHHERLRKVQYLGIFAALVGVCLLALGN
jgi:drug/metabolite transporter (DMT)-like permease